MTHSDDHRQSVLFQEMLPSWTKLLGDTAEHPREGVAYHEGHERMMQKTPKQHDFIHSSRKHILALIHQGTNRKMENGMVSAL